MRSAADRRSPTARPALAGCGLESFCAALCHDLRGPLATAGAAIHRLAALGGPPPGGGAASAASGPELLAIARDSLAKAEDLLSTLPRLLAAEHDAGAGRVDLEAVLARACEDVAVELRVAAGSVRVARPLPVVRAHPERLRIALRNLLSNAIRHRRQEVPLEIRVEVRRERAWQAVLVRDNGRGVAPAVRARLFAPLPATRPTESAGLGLGLAIARLAVRACGGELELRDQPGAGATFAIRLRPAAAEADLAARLRRRAAESGA